MYLCLFEYFDRLRPVSLHVLEETLIPFFMENTTVLLSHKLDVMHIPHVTSDELGFDIVKGFVTLDVLTNL
jgi:hypothetical protein